MPISFEIRKNEGYFISKWEGKITDKVMIDAYNDFYKGHDWLPDLNELADLSESDMTLISSEALITLGNNAEEHYKKNNIKSFKAAVYSPHDLPFGLARIYQSWSLESPENVGVFRDLNEAENWLKKEK